MKTFIVPYVKCVDCRHWVVLGEFYKAYKGTDLGYCRQEQANNFHYNLPCERCYTYFDKKYQFEPKK